MRYSTIGTLALVALGACQDAAAPTSPSGGDPADLKGGASAFVASDLGTLGGASSWAVAVNASGDVVGYSQTSSGALHAFIWREGVGMTDLGSLAGGNSFPRAIDSRDNVVGINIGSDNVTHAFAWSSNGGLRDLSPDKTYCAANGTNDAGVIVGACDFPGVEAYSWTQQAGYARFAGPLESYAMGVNRSGAIIGQIAGTSDPLLGPFYWSSATGLVRIADATTVRTVTGLNDRGQVTISDSPSSFLWTPQGGVVTIDPPADRSAISANGINNAGVVVGTSSTSTPYVAYPSLWTSEAGTVELTGLLGTNVTLSDINDQGTATGSKLVAPNTWHAYRWTGVLTARGTPASLSLARTSAVGGTLETSATSPSIACFADPAKHTTPLKQVECLLQTAPNRR